jgi:hypothetical protein
MPEEKASALSGGPTEYESLQQALRGRVRHLKAEAERYRLAMRGSASSIGVKRWQNYCVTSYRRIAGWTVTPCVLELCITFSFTLWEPYKW